MAVAALALVSQQVVAAREGLPASGAAKRDRSAKSRLTAVVVKQGKRFSSARCDLRTALQSAHSNVSGEVSAGTRYRPFDH
jgi:hypothetical protein